MALGLVKASEWCTITLTLSQGVVGKVQKKMCLLDFTLIYFFFWGGGRDKGPPLDKKESFPGIG